MNAIKMRGRIVFHFAVMEAMGVAVVMAMAMALLLFLQCAGTASAFELGDSIGLASRSSHADRAGSWRTSWVDMPHFLAPRFDQPDEAIFYAILLKGSGKNSSNPELVVLADTVTDFRINPEVDFRVSLAFDSHKFELPWITVYNAAQRTSLQKLEVAFFHDAYEVLRVEYKTTYGAKLDRVDPTHPAMRGFKLQYVWVDAEEEDFDLAKRVLLGFTVGAVLLIFSLVFYYSDKHLLLVVDESGSGKAAPFVSAGSSKYRGVPRGSYK